ncbi:MAG: hydantoinase/oxoprolinase family protein, partial [Roseovarius confluentis]
ELGLPRVLVPARPGITNAIGCVAADLRHDFVQTVNRPLRSLAEGELEAVFADQAARGRALVEAERVAVEEIVCHYSLDMQFVGQTHLLRVEVPDPGWSVERIRAAFERVYFNRFRVELERIEANVVNVSTSVVRRRSRWRW